MDIGTPILRGDRFEKDRGASLSKIRGVFAMPRELKRLRFTIKVSEHTPRCENQCATVFTSISPLKRGVLPCHFLNSVAPLCYVKNFEEQAFGQD